MGKVALVEDAPRVSETALRWLEDFKIKYTTDEVFRYLDLALPLKVGLIGEPIRDEYIYVTPRGRSAKEPVVTWKVLGTESYNGGIWAVLGHTLAVSDAVTILNNKTKAIIKTRYVQQPFLTKLFSVIKEETVYHIQHRSLANYDLITVVDYGHGLIPSTTHADVIADSAPWLALTVQANSLNWGMNTLQKWHKADYFVVDEAELRLSRRNSIATPSQLLLFEQARLNSSISAVTLGHNGCIIATGVDTDFYPVPIFSDHVVDRLGAGDAFLSVTAPLAHLLAPPEIIGLVGNVAGALQVSRVGNINPISRRELRQWIRALLA
jgi:hypothetical protein